MHLEKNILTGKKLSSKDLKKEAREELEESPKGRKELKKLARKMK